MSKLAGGCMLAAGVLIAGVSGICTLIFVGEAATNSSMIMPLISLGVFPFCIGVGLFMWGRSIIGKADAAVPPTPPPPQAEEPKE
jgi:hypothetical protein